MIYGAYGYTGKLVVEEAMRRGHRPVLAGRSEKKLASLAEPLGLNWIRVSLDASGRLTEAVAQVDLVFHAAGPFLHTSEPMIRACLAAGTHYIDITGEIPVFQNTFSHDQAALKRGISLISGAGFDVIPSDCLVDYVVKQVPNAVELEIAIAALGHASAGTIKTMLEAVPGGGWIRRDGRLDPYRFGGGIQEFEFPNGKHKAIPVPWGDLATAFQTTGIPNTTTYLVFPRNLVRLLRWMAPLSQLLLKPKHVRRGCQKLVAKTVHGPDAKMRQSGKSFIWARAIDAGGQEGQAWLETLEAYRFTAIGGVQFVEKILEIRPEGALTPALAVGADFVLQIEGTQRYDSLPTPS
jgi:short subunit dehydrogenase-like uncharacterized protein